MKLLKILDTKNSAGFTLIEVLISLAIFVIILGLGYFVNLDFYKSYTLSSERTVLVGLLVKARNNSIVNINESKHGIYLTANEYILFQGDNYLARDPIYDESIKVDSIIAHTGLTEIVFNQLTGEPNITGDIILTNGVRSAIISIQNEGRINW
ncbi:prepilin-type N-terminal cleavage/methylation domain-containing protein [Candidatus Azambacteria bacterium]|nr:prepilin-type N-terminal cleavage/methylation domain-containing protein [Candidatus Azambacteria bacterium]